MNYSFELFGQTIYSYNFFEVLGSVALLIVTLIINKTGLVGRIKTIHHIAIWLIFIVGANYGSMAMSYVVNFFKYSINDITSFDSFIYALSNTPVGRLFYGAVILIVLLIWIYCRIMDLSFKKYVGQIIPGAAIYMAFFRMGCLFAGCCYGVPSDFGYCFPIDSPIAPSEIRLFPTQLIMIIFSVVIFVAIIILLRRWGEENSFYALPFFVVSYGVMRFFLDFMRGDVPLEIFSLSVNQWASLASIIIVAAWWVWYKKKYLKK